MNDKTRHWKELASRRDITMRKQGKLAAADLSQHYFSSISEIAQLRAALDEAIQYISELETKIERWKL